MLLKELVQCVECLLKAFKSLIVQFGPKRTDVFAKKTSRSIVVELHVLRQWMSFDVCFKSTKDSGMSCG